MDSKRDRVSIMLIHHMETYPGVLLLPHLSRNLQCLELHHIQYNALIVSKPTNDSGDAYQE